MLQSTFALQIEPIEKLSGCVKVIITGYVNGWTRQDFLDRINEVMDSGFNKFILDVHAMNFYDDT